MASRAANCVRLKRCSALVSAGWRAQRENDRRKERGILAGRSKKNCGPHLTAVLLTDGSQVCIVYRLSTRVVPCAALAFPSLRRFLTVAPACWPQGKILPHPSARSALHSSPQDGGPKGKMIEGRSGGSLAGRSKKNCGPHLTGSAQPTDRRFVLAAEALRVAHFKILLKNI